MEPIDVAKNGIEIAMRLCHDAAVRNGWWNNRQGQRIQRNKGEMIALMHSELSEALEGERKQSMDSHLPHRRSAEVELSDTLIRIFDYAQAHGYDLAGAMAEKLAFNDQRPDHKAEARAKPDGKRF